MPEGRPLPRVVAAILLLDASVTFSNWWPTPAVHWSGAPSIELVVLLLALIAGVGTGRIAPSSRGVVTWLSGVWLLLVIGRYVDVTAPALWGRELNFWWDIRFLPDVAAMLLGASRSAVLLGSVAALAIGLVLTAVYLVVRWSFRQVLGAMREPRARVAIGVVCLSGIAIFALQTGGLFGVEASGQARRLFPKPVTQVYARQVRLVAQAMSNRTHLDPSPPLDANLARLKGADVFLFFVESYGAVAFERPEFNSRLQQPRALLETAIRETGREVVSAFVESPTFGGSSWFAHITFMSGIKVGDPDRNALLMTQQRKTIVTNFALRGYRTLAIMPGLWYPWPEGGFYGFQDIYTGPRLDYRGPSFGWWDMPDQFTLAKLDEQEVSKPDRPPLFVFYPTISTHTPFSPLAPYQPDWPTMLTPRPFTDAELDVAYVGDPDYMNLGPGYVDAVSYAYQTFAGYLHQRAGRDYVMLLIGDHQPPALVSGEGASWDVPIHVITNRREILEQLTGRGFVRGLTPTRPRLGQMHEVGPVLLDAFSENP